MCTFKNLIASLTLTFEIEDQGHILLPMMNYVVVFIMVCPLSLIFDFEGQGHLFPWLIMWKKNQNPSLCVKKGKPEQVQWNAAQERAYSRLTINPCNT